MTSALQNLARFPKFGNGVGLERCARLLDRLRITPTSSVGITGSNGKGSTAAMVSALLTGANLKTGLFTSPHFLNPTERFRINGVAISNDLVEQVAREVLEVARQIERASNYVYARFELLSVMAWRIFAMEKVQASVFEVGIGGRSDPTKLGRPMVTAITSLDLEHTSILGNTLEEIFADKIELTRSGGTCFSALPDDAALRTFCTKCAQEVGVSLLDISDEWPRFDYTEIGNEPHLRLENKLGYGCNVPLPLKGPWQARNAALAISCANAALESLHCKISIASRAGWLKSSLAKVEVPGRYQVVWDEPEVVVDAAHTPDAIRQVVEYINRTEDENGLLLVGISSDKPVAEMTSLLSKLRFPAVVSASLHGGADPVVIDSILQRQGISVLGADRDLPRMVKVALAEARRSRRKIFRPRWSFFFPPTFVAPFVKNLRNGCYSDVWTIYHAVN